MIVNGWLQSAKKIESPHFDLRPEKAEVSLLVIHNISLPPSQFEGHYVEDFFLGRLDSAIHPYFKDIASIRVSSHLYVRRNGDVIQFVPFNKRAWHSGVSCFNGQENCNDFSIGIELEGTDDIVYTDKQYQNLIEITSELQQAYPLINKQSIKGHCDIAPGRKTDPGKSFDWNRFQAAL
jgi:AmpD protein